MIGTDSPLMGDEPRRPWEEDSSLERLLTLLFRGRQCREAARCIRSASRTQRPQRTAVTQ